MLTVKNSALKSPLRSSDKPDIDFSLTDYWIRWQSLPMLEMLYSFVQSTAFVSHPEHKTDRSHLNGKTVTGSKISKMAHSPDLHFWVTRPHKKSERSLRVYVRNASSISSSEAAVFLSSEGFLTQLCIVLWPKSEHVKSQMGLGPHRLKHVCFTF